MKKKIYKTVFTLTVLSEDPNVGRLSEERLFESIDSGDNVGLFQVASTEIFQGKDAVDIIRHVGSEPEFFMMDEDGNEID